MKNSRIDLCSRCSGKGYTTREELVDYHKRDYEISYHNCEQCEGHGRIEIIESEDVQSDKHKLTKIYTKETRPYVIPSHVIEWMLKQ